MENGSQNLQTRLRNFAPFKSYGSMKMKRSFSMFAQKMRKSAKLWKPGNYIFSKALTEPNFMFPCSEIWIAGKTDPLDIHEL